MGKSWEQEIRGEVEDARRELTRAVAYVNDRIVPRVRTEGAAALRTAGSELRRLVEKLDAHGSRRG